MVSKGRQSAGSVKPAFQAECLRPGSGRGPRGRCPAKIGLVARSGSAFFHIFGPDFDIRGDWGKGGPTTTGTLLHALGLPAPSTQRSSVGVPGWVRATHDPASQRAASAGHGHAPHAPQPRGGCADSLRGRFQGARLY